jgi:hypothetical protein
MLSLEEAAKKTLIDAVCAVTFDSTALEIARWATMSPNGRASKFLDHYLLGSGLDIKVSIKTLMDEDSGVNATVQQSIRTALRGIPKPTSGVVSLPQRVFTNKDWQYATGSINMDWALNASCTAPGSVSVTLSFKNRYRWHPKEHRITQCLHQAAEDLKIQGARDFDMVGAPTEWLIFEHGGASGSW